ncbi:MAG: hypothetical protein WBI01_11060, partial [Syntrophomonadaceae bacterium]
MSGKNPQWAKINLERKNMVGYSPLYKRAFLFNKKRENPVKSGKGVENMMNMSHCRFQNTECEPAPQPTVKSYTWVQTRLVREAGPFYRTAIKSPKDVVELLNDRFDLENCDTEKFVAIYLNQKGYVN